jgi:hypothetical protein
MPQEQPIPATRYRDIGSQWAKITIERFQKQFPKLKINQGKLFNSFTQSVTATDSGIAMITFTYALYGQYVDMGVGRGVAVGARGSAAFSGYRNEKGQILRMKRRPKKWYSPVIFKEQVMLMHIMADTFGDKAVRDIVRNLPQKFEINAPI